MSPERHGEDSGVSNYTRPLRLLEIINVLVLRRTFHFRLCFIRFVNFQFILTGNEIGDKP